jgi:hypothetical protein
MNSQSLDVAPSYRSCPDLYQRRLPSFCQPFVTLLSICTQVIVKIKVNLSSNGKADGTPQRVKTGKAEGCFEEDWGECSGRRGGIAKRYG